MIETEMPYKTKTSDGNSGNANTHCNNAVASRTELVYLIENIDLYNTCVGVVYIQLHANCQAYPTCLSTQGPIRFIILLHLPF